jgi:hypothetical protein
VVDCSSGGLGFLLERQFRARRGLVLGGSTSSVNRSIPRPTPPASPEKSAQISDSDPELANELLSQKGEVGKLVRQCICSCFFFVFVWLLVNAAARLSL